MSIEGIVILIGITLPAIICGVVAVVRQTRHSPDDQSGAVEGSLPIHFRPDASGSNLRVRVNTRSSSSDAG